MLYYYYTFEYQIRRIAAETPNCAIKHSLYTYLLHFVNITVYRTLDNIRIHTSYVVYIL